MKTVLAELFGYLTPRAVVDVFQSYDVKLRGRHHSAPTLTLVEEAARGSAIVAGVVGFNGADVRGTFLLATTFELASLARPPSLRSEPLSRASSVDWILVRDWVGELCNQAIGRIKNRIHRYGIAFEVSPPTAFSGSSLVFAQPKGPAANRFAFSAGAHTVWFCLDALFDAERQVTAGTEETALGEGNVVFFD
jgi:CheY-specific phosphatase CheX